MERAKKKRAIIRTAVTRICNELEGLFEDMMQVGVIYDKLELLKVKETNLKELDKEIEDLIDEDALEQEIINACTYEDLISTTKSKANRLMKESEADRLGATGSASPHNSIETALPQSTCYKVRLPTLQLQRFSGKYSEWQSFWDQFDAAISKQESMSNIDKFSYLRSLLTGDAADAIAGIRLTDSNYTTATELLKNRFGCKDMVVNDLISGLLGLPRVKLASNVSELRKLYDSVQVAIRGLDTAGIQSSELGIILCPIIMKLLPQEFLLECCKRVKDSDLQSLLTFLRSEVETREKCQQFFTNLQERVVKDEVSTEQNRYKFKKPMPKSTLAFVNAEGHRNPYCVFCEQESHHSGSCTSHQTVQERLEKLKLQGRCFRCFAKGHMTKDCRNNRIRCDSCSRKHYPIMCNEKNAPKDAENVQVSLTTEPKKLLSSSDNNKFVLLQTIQAKVMNRNDHATVRGLLDGGSQRSFISQDLSRRLKLPSIGEENLEIYTFGETQPRMEKRRRVLLTLESKTNGQRFQFEFIEVPVICSNTLKIPRGDFLDRMREEGIELSDPPSDNFHPVNDHLQFLIGGDFYWEIITGKIKRFEGGLVAIESHFGWTLQGPLFLATSPTVCTPVGVMKVSVAEQDCSSRLQSFWELEHIGITDNAKGLSSEEERVLEEFNSSVRFVDGRYEVRLPWREGHVLNDNATAAQTRLKQQLRKLSRDMSVFSQYDEIIRKQLENGIVETAPSISQNERVYYMPHRAVFKEDRQTTKMRIVFDASSHEVDCQSLNDALYSGPNLNPELLKILLKFRSNKIAFVADIEKAFLQISLLEEDRDATRFLWIKKIPNSTEPPDIIALRMTRVLFGATCSPFLLAATIKHHIGKYEEEFPDTVKTLDSSLYVDDLISGEANPEAAFNRSREARTIMADAGMNLCKWSTNSAALKEMWKEDKEFVVHEESASSKILGLIWEKESDSFSFSMHSILEFLMTKEDTKRSVLQAVAQIFDPLGFLSPYLIRAKIFFQKIWQAGLKWDELLPDNMKKEWNEWCEELPKIHRLSFQRCYFSETSDDVTDVQLHVFCDASIAAYSTVAYLRSEEDSNGVTVRLVSSKARVAPLKRVCLPRLELLAALLAARMCNYIETTLELGHLRVFLWTDSMIAKSWIQSSPSRWKPFVANRVAEIQKLSNPESWNFCPGTENPADLPSRGAPIEALIQWKDGPQWLKKPEEYWPCQSQREVSDRNDSVLEKEAKKQYSKIQVAMTTLQPILDVVKFSSWKRLIRVTAWVSRFLYNVRNARKRKEGPLHADELNEAENNWIKVVQNDVFAGEIGCISKHQSVEKSSKLRDLNPFLDREGLLRVGGRLQFSNLNEDQQHPIILPFDHAYIQLFVQDIHVKLLHAGILDVMTELRERYWLISARRLVKQVIRKCVVCKRMNARPATEPIAPLPADRVKMAAPFEVTGVDFAGPLFVKSTSPSKSSKAYIALFTCATTRAVHLEAVSDLTTRSFLMSFRRFISRRGLPSIIYSDNAKTFKRADKEINDLLKMLKTEEVANYMAQNRILWKFNVEKAAWWGGFWERLVRSAKSLLRKTLGKAYLSFEELTTVLTQVEAVLNSRPLTLISSETQDPEPLTPANFLCGKRITALPSKIYKDEKSYSSGNREDIISRLRYRERVADQFWKRWVREYLLMLRTANTAKSQTSSNVQVGDFVLIEEDKLPRSKWKTAIVREVYPGRDGKIRSCKIKVSGGQELRRPIQLLYPLEFNK